MDSNQQEKKNIVFFDVLNAKDVYTTTTLSLDFQHEIGVEEFLPKRIEEACEVSGIKGIPCNLRFYDIERKKKLTIKDIKQFPSGELTDASDEEIENAIKKISEYK